MNQLWMVGFCINQIKIAGKVKILSFSATYIVPHPRPGSKNLDWRCPCHYVEIMMKIYFEPVMDARILHWGLVKNQGNQIKIPRNLKILSFSAVYIVPRPSPGSTHLCSLVAPHTPVRRHIFSSRAFHRQGTSLV